MNPHLRHKLLLENARRSERVSLPRSLDTFPETITLDGGGHTLEVYAIDWGRQRGVGRWAYFDSEEHSQYLQNYASLVREFEDVLDWYSNVDATGNVEITQRNQKVLEREYDLHPVPVFHEGSDFKELERLIRSGYEMVILGGMAFHRKAQVVRWLDEVFGRICKTPPRLPRVKLHGHQVTDPHLILRYPWWSVDGSSWNLDGACGNIVMPHKRGGIFVFDEGSYKLGIKEEYRYEPPGHLCYWSMSKAERAVVREWLEEVGVPLGRIGGEGDGVINNHYLRRQANLYFYQRVASAARPWPWAFHCVQPPSLVDE